MQPRQPWQHPWQWPRQWRCTERQRRKLWRLRRWAPERAAALVRSDGHDRRAAAISGGTLLVTFDGRFAVASDPDRDALYGVNLETRSLAFEIALQKGDEPGRLAEDSAGRVHVALRGGGALLTIVPDEGAVLARRTVCPAPRGVAWAASGDLVWVACATGELVALPASGGTPAQSLVLRRDLRDVVAQPDGTLIISTFRSAEVLRVGGDGSILGLASLPIPASAQVGTSRGPAITASAAAHVAWRTIAGPSVGSTVSVYQTESTQSISTNQPGGYGGFGGRFGGSSGESSDDPGTLFASDAGPPSPPLPPFFGPIVESVVAMLDNDGGEFGSPIVLPETVLPVDVALSPERNRLAIAGAGNGFGTSSSVWLVTGNRFTALPWSSSSPAVAVAFDGRGNVLAQTLEPEASLSFVPVTSGPAGRLSSAAAVLRVSLSTTPNHNTGHDIFHTQAGAFMACASCHPEGGDDGHVWQLDGLPRRTPSLRGTIAGTAPYHWPGEELDMSMLIDDVYTHRMSGTMLDDGQRAALTTWVEAIVAPRAPSWVDSSAAGRGKVLFEGSAGCAACHSGAKFTNNATVDVGTGTDIGRNVDGGPAPTAFQVPPLVGVGWRMPLLHDGCASTMQDRFGRCATPQHGSTAQLSQQEIEDLTAYLESL